MAEFTGAFDAVPSFTTSYRTCMQVEEARKAQVQEEKLKSEFLSLEELLEKLDLSRLPSEVMFVTKNEAILFFKISPSRDPQILYALQIENSLDFSCWFEGERVNSKTSSQKISSCSQLMEILRQIYL